MGKKKFAKRHGAAWGPEEVLELLAAYRRGASVTQLAAVFERTAGAIRSQLRRSGVDLKAERNNDTQGY